MVCAGSEKLISIASEKFKEVLASCIQLSLEVRGGMVCAGSEKPISF